MKAFVIKASVLAAVALFAPALAGVAEAGYGAPVCARVNGGAHMGAYDDCSYFSFEQCRIDRIGIGGFCVQNPYYVWAEEPPPRKRHRRR